MEDQAEAVIRTLREDAELKARMDDEARATAHAMIPSYLGQIS